MALDPVYKTDAVVICKNIVNGDGTGLVDVYDNTAGTKHKRITALNATSDDPSPITIQFFRWHDDASYLLGAVTVPALSGTVGGTPRVICLSEGNVGAKDESGIWTLNTHAGDKLQAKLVVAVASGKTAALTGSADSYE